MKCYSKRFWCNCVFVASFLWLCSPCKRKLGIWCHPSGIPHHAFVACRDSFIDFSDSGFSESEQRGCFWPFPMWWRGRIRVMSRMEGGRCVYDVWPFQIVKEVAGA